MNKVSSNIDAPKDAVDEAIRRNGFDGIPRHVYSDGRIMKYDWVLEDESEIERLEGERLEEHIRKLIDEQTEREVGSN